MKMMNLAFLGAVAMAVGAASKRKQLADAVGDAAARIAAPPPPPPRAQRNIFVRLYQEIEEDRLLSVAAGVAFYALLALAPSLAAAVSLFGLVADPAQLTKLSGSLNSVLPPEAAQMVHQQAQRLASQGAQALSFKLAIALALSLWSSSSAVRALFDALNVIDEQEEKRGILSLYGAALATTLAGVIVFILSLAVIGANPKFIAFGPLPHETVWLYSVLRWPIFFCVAVLVIAALYWIGPSHPPARYWRLLPGAALAALLWAIGSFLFSWYVETLANYTATYGSLATVVVMMTWLWLSAAIVLLGAQLNFELTRRRKAT